MEDDGGRWGNVLLLILLAGLISMVGVLTPVTATARAYIVMPEPTVEATQIEVGPTPVAATAIGDHYHEWSMAVELFRRGAGTR